MAAHKRFLSLLLWLIGGVFLCLQFAFASDDIPLKALPPEAQQTLRLIKANGPFPYDRDGIVFGNFEKRLAKEPRGYYHEYTVKTPGARNRGARRIVCGPLPECYYTGDHYQSFQRIEEKK